MYDCPPATTNGQREFALNTKCLKHIKIKERRLRTKDQFDFPQLSNGSWIPERGIYFHGLYQSQAFQIISIFLKWRLNLTIPWQINDLLSIAVAQHSRTFLSCPERVHVRLLPRYESACQWVNWLIIDFKPWLYNFEPVKLRIART